MGRAGLLTFYHIHHYGAVLQAAATQRALEALGWECEIVDYFVNQNNALFCPPVTLGAAAADIHTALHYAPLRRRHQRFEDFSREHLHISHRRYERLEELAAADLPYDLLLSGSDQIWNPAIFPDGAFDPVFFGTFSQKRRIAYAPSFGPGRLSQAQMKQLKAWLRGYSHLSAREAQGRRLLAAAGYQAPVVLDPTLLLTAPQWAALSHPPANAPAGAYLLCYCISPPGPLLPYLRRLQKDTGLEVVQLCGMRRQVSPGVRQVLDAGPGEFLSLFQNAAFVLTNSFHGTVFSLLFQRPFFTAVSPAEAAAPEESRIMSLLSPLGLAGRVVGRGDTHGPDRKICWSGVAAALDTARAASRAYLQAALENRPYAPSQAPPVKATEQPRLAAPERCTGCTACAAVCPRDAVSMERDACGFDAPAVDLQRCVHCGKCSAVCPLLQRREKEPERLPAAFAVWHRDDAIRAKSTSGGAFGSIAQQTLQSGGAVWGAALDHQQHLRHVCCEQAAELDRLRGAKYVQSDLWGVFREIRRQLKEDRRVLFAGTPCQVDGLYHFLGSRPALLVTCDLVCQGVPAPGVWEAAAGELERRRGKKLAGIYFRDKSAGGWQKSRFTAVYEGGGVESRPLFDTPYGRGFGRALFLRQGCHRCPYANLNRPGDFTLGDLWGLGPEEFPTQQQKGISLLLVNTAKGQEMLEALDLERHPYPIERAAAGNPRLRGPMAAAPDRGTFFAAFALEPFEEVERRFLSPPPWPLRAVGRLLTPETKKRIRRFLRR